MRLLLLFLLHGVLSFNIEQTPIRRAISLRYTAEEVSPENCKKYEGFSPKKTIYLIRHAETEENIRGNYLRKVGKSVVKLRPPHPYDVYKGSQFLGMTLIGRTDSIVSNEGSKQILAMRKILLEENFTSKMQKIAHSPLIRAKETCYGVLDLENNSETPVESLESLREISPFEYVFRGGRRQVKNRIEKLCEWLDEQEEENVAIVGHSQYFMVMLGLKKRFHNCDVWKATYFNGEWTNLELQYRLN